MMGVERAYFPLNRGLVAASRAPQQASSDITTVAIAAGTLLGVLGVVFGLPGVALAWFGILLGAHFYPTPVLTGKKDARGYPTALNPAEEARQTRYRFWSDVKWKLVIPNRDWFPGVPKRLQATWVLAVIAAGVAACLPAAWWWVRPANAVAAFILVATRWGAKRRSWLPENPCDGALVNALPAFVRAHPVRAIVSTLLGLVAASALLAGLGALEDSGLVATLVSKAAVALPNLPVEMLAPAQAPSWAVRAAVLTTGAAVGLALTFGPWTMEHFHVVRLARQQWASRWEMLRIDPAPRLLDRQQTGSAIVDTFESTGAQAASTFACKAMNERISPLAGAGARVAVVSSPDIDPSTGQPVPGTRHPMRFQTITWSEGMPDIAAAEVDPAVAELAMTSAMAWAAYVVGWQPPILDQASFLLADPAPDEADDAQEERGEHDPFDEAFDDQSPAEATPTPTSASRLRLPSPRPLFSRKKAEPPTSLRGVWASTWFLTDTNMVTVRQQFTPAAATSLGCEGIADHRAGGGRGVVYLGDLSGSEELDPAKAPFPIKSGDLRTEFRNLATEDRWLAVWAAVNKNDPNPPTIRHDVYEEATLADGKVIISQPFVPRQGVDPVDTFGLEPKIATALEGMAFVSVTGFPNPRSKRPGDRHPQAFTVSYCKDPVPTPDRLAPAPGNGPRRVLAGHMNRAFEAAFGKPTARPEVYRVKAYTKPQSPVHIWEVWCRLYGKVTLDDVRKKHEVLANTLGVEWLRVVADENGCRIMCGGDPERAELTRAAMRSTIAAYDWEQAWYSSGVVGAGGRLPELTETASMPRNERVQVLDFNLPPGVSLDKVKGAVDKLSVATHKGWIDVRSSPRGAGSIRLLAAPDNPMPTSAPYEFDFVPEKNSLAFAVGIDGEPIQMNFKEIAHLLLAGTSGGGKTAGAQALLYGALATLNAECVVIDPQKKAADFKFAREHCIYMTSPELDENEALMQTLAVAECLYADVKDRARLNGIHGVSSSRELPPEVRPRTRFVFIDEFLGVIMAGNKPPTRTEDDPEMEAERLKALTTYNAKKRIAFIVDRLAAEARSADYHLVLMTQKLTQDMLGDLRSLKTNLNRVLLGKTTYGDRQSALRDPDSAPPLGDTVGPGRGIWEPVTGSPTLMQFWYVGAETYQERLYQDVQPLSDDDALDFTPFLKKVNDVTPAFTVIEDNVADPVPSVELDLGELDLSEMTFDLEDEDEDEDPSGLPEPVKLDDDAPPAPYTDLGEDDDLQVSADGDDEPLLGDDDWLDNIPRATPLPDDDWEHVAGEPIESDERAAVVTVEADDAASLPTPVRVIGSAVEPAEPESPESAPEAWNSSPLTDPSPAEVQDELNFDEPHTPPPPRARPVRTQAPPRPEPGGGYFAPPPPPPTKVR